jgi:hypothetical protein
MNSFLEASWEVFVDVFPLAGGRFSQSQLRDAANHRRGNSDKEKAREDEEREGEQHLDREALKAFSLNRIVAVTLRIAERSKVSCEGGA